MDGDIAPMPIPPQGAGRDFNALFRSPHKYQNPIPDNLRSCLLRRLLDTDELHRVCPVLTQPLTLDNYTTKFQALLHLEEFERTVLRGVLLHIPIQTNTQVCSLTLAIKKDEQLGRGVD